jgi:hypothetical protein
MPPVSRNSAVAVHVFPIAHSSVATLGSANRDGPSVVALLGRPARRVGACQHEGRGKGVTTVKGAFERRDHDPVLARLGVATNRDLSLSEDGLVILAHGQVGLKHLVTRITRRHHNRAHGAVRQELCPGSIDKAMAAGPVPYLPTSIPRPPQGPRGNASASSSKPPSAARANANRCALACASFPPGAPLAAPTTFGPCRFADIARAVGEEPRP